MLMMIRTRVKSAAIQVVKTLEDMEEVDLCLFVFLSIYNAYNIGSHFGRKYPGLGHELKGLLFSLIQS